MNPTPTDLLFLLSIILLYNLHRVVKYRRNFYKNPIDKRCRIGKIKATVQAHYSGTLYIVVSNYNKLSIADISEIKPIYFEL